MKDFITYLLASWLFAYFLISGAFYIMDKFMIDPANMIMMSENTLIISGDKNKKEIIEMLVRYQKDILKEVKELHEVVRKKYGTDVEQSN